MQFYRALSNIGWAELGLRDKLLLVFLWPIALLRALSVPSAGPEGQWSRSLAVLSPMTAPLLTLFASKGTWRNIIICMCGILANGRSPGDGFT